MLHKLTLRIMAILLCVMSVISMLPLTVKANSAQSWWQGTDATGTIVMDEECPIIVEKEVLIFDILEFPETYYEDEEEALEYGAKVTAEYTFYNPSDYTVTARLFFPFGNLPMYLDGYYDHETGKYELIDDTDKYEITVNGEGIEKKIRHTFSPYRQSFDLEEDLPLLIDGYAKDDFYYPEQKITKYVFEISDVNEGKYSAASVGFDYSKEEIQGKRKYWIMDGSGFSTLKNGDYRVHTWADNGEQITLFVIGEALEELPKWTFYEDGGVNDKEKINGTCKLISKEEMTFEEWTFCDYTAESGVLASDWYNAMIQELYSCEDIYGLINHWGDTMDLSHSLMRWYEYEITLAPGERIVNTVTAPMYPDVDAGYEPAIYEYTYLLSPAKTWKEFGPIEVIVNTPYYMLESSLKGFEEFDSNPVRGYQLSLSGLPEEELKFTLCSSEETQARSYFSKYGTPRLIKTWIIGGAVVLFGIGVVVALVRQRKGYK